MPDSEICSRCLKAKTVTPGSISGLYEVCNCSTASSIEQQAITVLFCNICKKQINQGRQGSFTQWVFRPVLCECENPEIIQKVELIDRDKLIAESSEVDEHPELDVDGFPSDRFSPREKLGSGATSEVFLSRDRFLRKDVSVKLLRWLNDETIVAFQNEARVNAALKHRNIVEILDFGVSDSGVPFLVQDYIEGATLEEYLAEHGPMDTGSVISFFAEVADALAYAHSKGVMHRDLKPSNFLVVKSENRLSPRLIDFGIAHMKEGTATADGIEVAGTPRYMAPDTANGLDYDSRSEIYSLGCVMYAALTGGSPPFDGDTSLEILSRHSTQPPEPIEAIAGEPLESVIFKCLEKSPAERFESAISLKEALRSISDLPGPLEPEIRKAGSDRNRIAVVAVSAIAAITIATTGALVASRLLKQSEPESRKARPVKEEEIETAFQADNLGKAFLESTMVPHADSTIEYLQSIRKNPDAEVVNLFMCDVKDSDLDFIGGTRIKALNLSYNPVTNVTMKRLENVETLEALVLRAVNITDDGIESISRLPNLKRLTVSAIPLTPRSFDAIARIKSLERLYLETFDNLSEEEIRKLKKLPKLEMLLIARCKISVPVARELIDFPAMWAVDLSNCSIADGVIETLAKSRRFTDIILSGSDFPPGRLKVFNSMKSLKVLNVVDCPNVETSEIKKLIRTRPDLQVYATEKNISLP
ncbi:MAG: protein kinase [Cyanobacteria bacterium HKST-UBA02]|nr:protein kinase [Cyanobacteria bacterium HKST-UBA02]